MPSQFDIPASMIEPDGFYPVRVQQMLTDLNRGRGKRANVQGTLSVRNIADKRGQFDTMARIYCSIEVMHGDGEGRRTEESFSFDVSDATIDAIIAELTAHRNAKRE